MRRLASVAAAASVAGATVGVSAAIAWFAAPTIPMPQPGSAQPVTVWLGRHDLACTGWVHTVPEPGQVDAGECTTALSHAAVYIAVWAGDAPDDAPRPDGWGQATCNNWTATSLDLRWIEWVTRACDEGTGMAGEVFVAAWPIVGAFEPADAYQTIVDDLAEMLDQHGLVASGNPVLDVVTAGERDREIWPGATQLVVATVHTVPGGTHG